MPHDKRATFVPSIKLSDQQTRQLRDELIEQQTYAGAAAGGVLGALAGIAVYLVFWFGGIIPVVLFFVPGVAAGYVAKLTGKAFELGYRAVCGLVTLVLLWFTAWYIHGSPITLFLALPNAVLAVALSRRKLSKEQEYSIYKHRMGLE